MFGSYSMQVKFEVTDHTIAISLDEVDNNTEDEHKRQTIYAANDNGSQWPLLPFPPGWYASG